MTKHIPNLFTLLNLFLGCLALVWVLQPGLTYANDETGMALVVLPEKTMGAAWLVFGAAVVDFLDGFLARLLKQDSAMGKELDSLSDVVSFGVVPGMVVWQFLRLAWADSEQGLDLSMGWLLPALLLPLAGAWRLARFNTDTTQRKGFSGLPIPAAGCVVVSLPLVYGTTEWPLVIQLMGSPWFWYGWVLLVAALMVSTLPMLGLKLEKWAWKPLLPFVFLMVISLGTALFFGWLAIPVGFFAYVLLSLAFKSPA